MTSIRHLAPIGYVDAVVNGNPVRLPVTTVADWAADMRDQFETPRNPTLKGDTRP